MKRDSGEDSPSERIENKEDYSAEPSGSDLGADHGFTLEEQKRIMWRLDRRLVPVLGVMYCVSLMDRTNLGAASIAGMTTDLMLIGDRYVSGLTMVRPACWAGQLVLRSHLSNTATDLGRYSPSSRSCSSSRTSSSNRRRQSSCANSGRGFTWRASQFSGARVRSGWGL